MRLLLLATSLIFTCSASSGWSETLGECAKRPEMVANLAEQFKENPAAVGVVNENRVLEVFTAQTGTWTIVVTDTEGRSCVIAAGDGWDNKNLPFLPGA